VVKWRPALVLKLGPAQFCLNWVKRTNGLTRVHNP